MTQNDTPRPGDVMAALALLSRLPLPFANHTRGADAAWAWPVAGAVLGLLAGLAGWLALVLGLPPALAAGVALAMGPILTGGLHEDGLADTCDGLWGGWTRERRLEIMKDSHIGSYGVIALVLSLGLRWVALATVFETGHVIAVLIGAATLSRLPMVVLSHHLPAARPGGLSGRVGAPSGRTVGLATLAAVLIAIPCLGLATVPALIALALGTLALGAIAKARIGGQTGDILGASQQSGEIAVLLTLAAALG